MPHVLILRFTLAIIFILLIPNLSLSGELDFETWLSEFRIEAKAAGISHQTLDKALTGLRPLPQVIKLDRHQPESRKTLDQYLDILISKRRIDQGHQRLRDKSEFFHGIEKEYGVPGHILVALWGIESNFGTNTGKLPVIASLATLAYDPRRSSFFCAPLSVSSVVI